MELFDTIENEERFYEEFSRLSRIFAENKAKRSGLEEYRKVLRAQIMVEAGRNGVKSHQTQQRDAEADPRYLQIVLAFETAIELETRAYMEIELLRMKFEKWRTARADERAAMNLR